MGILAGYSHLVTAPPRARGTVVTGQECAWLLQAQPEVGLQDANVGVDRIFAVVVGVHLEQ